MRIEGREGSRRQDKALEVAVSTFCSALLSPSPPASWSLTSARKSSRRTHLDLLAAAQTSAMKYLARLTLIFRRVTETTWKRSMHARGKPRTSRHYIPPTRKSAWDSIFACVSNTFYSLALVGSREGRNESTAIVDRVSIFMMRVLWYFFFLSLEWIFFSLCMDSYGC